VVLPGGFCHGDWWFASAGNKQYYQAPLNVLRCCRRPVRRTARNATSGGPILARLASLRVGPLAWCRFGLWSSDPQPRPARVAANPYGVSLRPSRTGGSYRSSIRIRGDRMTSLRFSSSPPALVMAVLLNTVARGCRASDEVAVPTAARMFTGCADVAAADLRAAFVEPRRSWAVARQALPIGSSLCHQRDEGCRDGLGFRPD